MAKRHTTIEAHGSHAWMNSNGVLDAGADNVLCSRLATAAHAAMNASAGDSIDRGLALLAEMRKQGFGVIYLGEPERAPSVPAAATVERQAALEAQAREDFESLYQTDSRDPAAVGDFALFLRGYMRAAGVSASAHQTFSQQTPRGS